MNDAEIREFKLSCRRITRLVGSNWLSFTDLCFHCGFMETEMRELTRRRDFPVPSNPTGSGKGKRWSKEKVDAWMEAHEMEKDNA